MIEEIVLTLIERATKKRTIGLSDTQDERMMFIENHLPDHTITDVLMRRGRFLNYKQVITHTVDDISYSRGMIKLREMGVHDIYNNFLIALWLPDPDLLIREVFNLIDPEHIVLVVYP